MDLSLPVMTSVEQCVLCPKGTFCSVGSAEPTPCLPGSFNQHTNATTCSLCAAGTYQSDRSATACSTCVLGHYCAQGAVKPVPCASGTFGGSTGLESAGQCEPCPQGHYCGLGSVQPQGCDTGSFSDSPGQALCTPCKAGYYQNSTSATSCYPCAKGHWCTADTPIPCSENTYNTNPLAHRVTNCTRCPERTSTLTLSFRTSADDCFCSAEYYRAPSSMDLSGMDKYCKFSWTQRNRHSPPLATRMIQAGR